MEDSGNSKANQDEDVMACPNCLGQNDPMAEFCSKCGRPMGILSTIDPLQRTLSIGWMYRKSSSGKIGIIGLIGMWFIVLPAILMVSGIIHVRLREVSDYAQTAFAILPSFLYAVLLYKVTRNYFAQKKRPTDDEDV